MRPTYTSQRPKGMDSGIGTPTHTEYVPLKYRRTSKERAIYSHFVGTTRPLLTRIATRKNEIRQEITRAAKVWLCQTIFCTVCGESLPYDGSEVAAWSNKRRCPTCLNEKRSGQRIRHCRQCGRVKTQEEYFASCTVNNPQKGWATWAVCDQCRETRAAPRVDKQTFADAYRKDPEIISLKNRMMEIWEELHQPGAL